MVNRNGAALVGFVVAVLRTKSLVELAWHHGFKSEGIDFWLYEHRVAARTPRLLQGKPAGYRRSDPKHQETHSRLIFLGQSPWRKPEESGC